MKNIIILITVFIFIPIFTFSQSLKFSVPCENKFSYDSRYHLEWEVWSKDNSKVRFFYRNGDELQLNANNWYCIRSYYVDSCGVIIDHNTLTLKDGGEGSKNSLEDGPTNYYRNGIYYYKAKPNTTLVIIDPNCILPNKV